MGTSPDSLAGSPAPASAGGSRRRSRLARLAGGLAGLIWPQRSLLTGRELVGPGAIEPELWAKIAFLSPPWCAVCGTPFEIAVADDQVCGACLAHPPVYDRARAAMAYGDVSRDLVLALKYQGRRDGLEVMAGWMAAAGAELVTASDLIVPVPLHYLRLVRRGFNQSVWLGAALGRRTGLPMSPDLLKRARATAIQGGLSPDARRRNVQGAFRVRNSRLSRLKGRRVLLVDDVFTTGATAEACARALKRGGAACVNVLTLTRVAGPRSVPI